MCNLVIIEVPFINNDVLNFLQIMRAEEKQKFEAMIGSNSTPENDQGMVGHSYCAT